MEQQPKIPTLKDAQKPQVKIKGMGAGLTLFDRLKQFKKKDLAFILAGLGTLFMAPLAEHFMMAPENGDMSSGFRGPGSGGTGLFGSGSSPYEIGNNGIAQGGAIGGSGDIITPLNVRDPSALVMGPGSSQQPPAGSAAAVTPPPTAPTTSSEDLKDALRNSAARGASAAVKKAPLPVPKIAFSGSGLRGLGAASGGSSSGSGSLGPINSGNLGQAGTGGGGLNLVRSAPNFRSAAGARGPNSPSGLDGTKKAGANAGDAFSRTGSALGGLNAAAAEQIPTGGQGFGGGGQGGAGANDKPGGGAGAAGSKSVGESLAFIEAKERMMEGLKLEFEKRKLKDPELLLYGIRNDTAKTIAGELTKMSMKKLGDMWAGKDAAGNTKYICGVIGGTPPAFEIPLSTPKCDKDVKDMCFRENGQYAMGTTLVTCQKMGDGTAKIAGGAETAPTTPPAPTNTRPTREDVAVHAELELLCAKLNTAIVGFGGGQVAAPVTAGTVDTSKLPATDAGNLAKAETMMKHAAAMVAARNALYFGGNSKCTTQNDYLGTVKTPAFAEANATAAKSYENAVAALAGAGTAEDRGGIGLLEKGVPEKTDGHIKGSGDKFTAAQTSLDNAEKVRAEAAKILEGVIPGDFVALNTGGTPDPAATEMIARARETVGKLKNLAESDKKLGEEYKKLLDGARLASDGEKGTAKTVVDQNAALDKSRGDLKTKIGVDVTDAELKYEPKAPTGQAEQTAGKTGDWAGLSTEVENKAKLVKPELDKVDKAITEAKAAIDAKADDAEAKKKAAKDALIAAVKPVGETRAAQTTFLTGLRTGVEKAGRPEVPVN